MRKPRASFGTNLRAARDRKQFTQRELAEKTGLSREYIARLEADGQDPSLSVAARLAAILGVNLDDLRPVTV